MIFSNIEQHTDKRPEHFDAFKLKAADFSNYKIPVLRA